MSRESDRRKHARIDLVLKVEYQSPMDFLADYVSNVSSGGLFIATDQAFELGEKVHFEISFPGLLSPIRCTGEVRWRRLPQDATDDDPSGIGMAFVFPNDEKPAELVRLTEKLDRHAEAQVADADPHPETVPAKAFRVLLVEDNESVRNMFQYAVKKFHRSRLARNRRLEVVEAEDGQKAWELLQNESFDMAIIDHYLPVMKGVQLTCKIRSEERICKLPVIMVSVGGDEVKQSSYAAGADLYLNKPLVLNQLLKSMAFLMGLSDSEE